VLAHEAQRARAAGHEQIAAEIDQQIDRMRRQIDYHLAHARSAAAPAVPGACASIAASAEGLVRALERLHAERDLSIESDTCPSPISTIRSTPSARRATSTLKNWLAIASAQ
jgi:hypothetical protein